MDFFITKKEKISYNIPPQDNQTLLFILQGNKGNILECLIKRRIAMLKKSGGIGRCYYRNNRKSFDILLKKI